MNSFDIYISWGEIMSYQVLNGLIIVSYFVPEKLINGARII